ncbi:MAG: sodium/proton-translocating pyrophosphatase, partial [Chitinophagaceae bacterium]
LIIGFAFGPEALGGFLAGATVSGVLMGMFQSNAVGAWDNAKKSFEKGVEINGETYYKKSEPHKASVTGDTVGDPFKDTSGPSMNILIKLMSIVSLVIAPHIANGGHGSAEGDCCKKDKMEMHGECAGHDMGGSKCDMSVCATMTKAQCDSMCTANGCDSAERAHCMSMYNDKGEFVGQCMESCGKKCPSKDECMKNCGETCAAKHSDANCHEGPAKACCKDKAADAAKCKMEGKACCKGENTGKACASDPSKCEMKGKGCCKDAK